MLSETVSDHTNRNGANTGHNDSFKKKTQSLERLLQSEIMQPLYGGVNRSFVGVFGVVSR